ncbi:MAG: hypothetical protein IPN27_11960 [Cellvibrionales bacterium]|jgi:hypothetical protein|nr:hypothetical protein [Cellvibrionales bacterium]
MKFSHASFVVLASVALAACSTQSISPIANISPDNPDWKFSQVRVSGEKNETVISANLHPTKFSRAKGYIQVRAVDKNGTLLATSECKKTPMHPKRVNRRQQVVSGGYTEITLPVVLQPDTRIDLGVFNNKSCTSQAL